MYTDDLLLNLRMHRRFAEIAVIGIVASTKLDPVTLTLNFYGHLTFITFMQIL